MLPVFVWVPLTVSAVLLGASWTALWTVGDVSRRGLAVFTAWFLVATYLQLFGGSLALRTSGLVSQVILAVVLIVRRRWESSGV